MEPTVVHLKARVLSFHCCVLSASLNARAWQGLSESLPLVLTEKVGVWEALEGL